jgi:hypothetical protein
MRMSTWDMSSVVLWGRLLRWLIVLCWVVVWIGIPMGWWRFRSSSWLGFFIASLFALGFIAAWVRWQREHFVRESPLPQFLKRKLREAYPQLSQKDCDLVERGLRQFFVAYLRSGHKFVAMPSRVVDAMWHEFILHTKAYEAWCRVALGRFLHHTPSEALGGDARRNDGLRRAWFWSCKEEAIDPRAPTRLPLLFALDAKLAIPDGFHYLADCSDIARKSDAEKDGKPVHCGGSMGDGSHSGDADGFGGSESSSGDSGDSSCGGD